MNTPEAALRALIDAIDNNVERRVLLDKRPGERRTEAVITMRSIAQEYIDARRCAVDTARSLTELLTGDIARDRA